MEEWSHRRDEPYLFPQAGEAAAEQARRAAAGKSGLQRLLEDLFDVRTDERSWRRGAAGEREVARRLAKLPQGWSVVHDLTIGSRGANLDHLVIGPPGVFTLNTKNLSSRVTVYPRTLMVGGYKTDYLPKATAEARRVGTALTQALGRSVVAWPLIVVMAPELVVKQQPVDATVISRRAVPRWFLQQRAQHLSPGDIIRLEGLARTRSTWSARPTDTRAASPDAAPTPGLTVNEWKRFGKHRLYVNDPGGATLGWMDVETGHVTVEVDDRRAEVLAALQKHVRREWR